MATTNNITMTIRTNKAVKEQASKLFRDLGLDMSTAVNIFLRQSVRENKIPFEVTREEKPNRRTRRAIKNAMNDKNMIGPFKTVEEAMKYLNA